MTEQETTVTVSTPSGDRKLTENDFMGMSKYRAQNKAEGNNLIFRLIRIDDRPMFSYPEAHRSDRVCVEIDNGEITKVVFQ